MNCFTLHLGNTEAILIDAIQLRGGPRIERGVVPVAMELEEGVADDPDAYPLKIQLRHQKLEHLTAWRTNAHSVQADGTVHEERGGIDAAIHSGRDGERDTEPVLTGEEGSLKTIRAKYVIGSDGAHSWVRRWLGFEMEGDSTNAVWGVVDAILDSDFPE
jgi:phenol 2-monooxygenase